MSSQTCTDRPRALAETHEVFNQASPLEGYNLFAPDAALREGVAREGADWAQEDLKRYGEICGRPEVIELGFLATNTNPSSTPTTATATGWTRSATTPAIISCCGWR